MNHYSHFGMWKSGVCFYPSPKIVRWHHSRGCGRSVFQRSRCSSFGSICTGVFCRGIPTNHFPFNQTVPVCFSQVMPAFLKQNSLRKIIIKDHVAFPLIIAISNSFSVSSQINNFLLKFHMLLPISGQHFSKEILGMGRCWMLMA